MGYFLVEGGLFTSNQAPTTYLKVCVCSLSKRPFSLCYLTSLSICLFFFVCGSDVINNFKRISSGTDS